jgi:hypothetical protein
MTKKSLEHFAAYLDVLQGTCSYAETSRALGQAESTIYRWLSDSKRAAVHPEGPSEFFFAYGEVGEAKWLHEHVRDCITTSIEEIESAARGRARYGTWTIAKFQGKTVYQTDPDLEQLGFTGPEAYRRDPITGEPLPELVWSPPSTDLVQLVLQAHSKKYRRQSSISMDVNNRVSGGVMIIGGNKPAVQNITHQAPLPILEIIEEAEAEPARTEEQPQPFDDAEGDEEQAAPTLTSHGAEPAPAAPAQPRPATARGPLTELQRDLLSRLKAAPGTPERMAPPPRVSPRNADDYSKARTGAGPDPAALGGHKMA